MRSTTLGIMTLAAATLLAACATTSDSPGAATTDASAGEATEAPAAEAPRLIQPGAPGEPSREISVEEATDLSGVAHTEADVRFMQGMIHHHAQAIAMTELVPERSASEAVRLLAQRIDLSQVDEIGMMEGWLRARGEMVPPADGHGEMMMPGMLSDAEMEALAAANGEEFDQLFLEGMIKHHGGALIMVDNLFAQPGAGQESIMNAFASEVVADQRAEMDRMAAMLARIRQQDREKHTPSMQRDNTGAGQR